MANTSIRKDGRSIYVVGRSRSGKTQYALKRIAELKAKRMLVWDSGALWAGILGNMGYDAVEARSPAELSRLLFKDHETSNLIVCYVPPAFGSSQAKQFELVCGLFHLWNQLAPATFVVEEISSVVKSGVTVGTWQTVQNQGQKYGGNVVAIIQRFQEGDKTTMTQATELVIFAQNERDINYIETNIGLNRELVPTDDFLFLKIDKKGGKSAGKIDFNNSKNPANYKFLLKKIP